MKKSVSIVVPAYKEEGFIEKFLFDLLKVFRNQKIDFEIIMVIDKAPNDKTYDIVKNISNSSPEIIIVSRENKQGIGSAIREGVKYANKDLILFTAAEISEDPNDLLKMVLKMNQGYDMVFGNRFYRGAKRPGYNTKKYIGNRVGNYLIKFLFGIKSNDISNGVKIYKNSILKNMKTSSYGFGVFAEMPITAYMMGYRNIGEVKISHHAREEKYSKFNLVKEGMDFFTAIMRCFFQKFTYKN